MNSRLCLYYFEGACVKALATTIGLNWRLKPEWSDETAFLETPELVCSCNNHFAVIFL